MNPDSARDRNLHWDLYTNMILNSITNNNLSPDSRGHDLALSG